MYRNRYPYKSKYYDRDYYDRYHYRDYYYNSQIGSINQNLLNYGYMNNVNQIANQYQYMYDSYRRRY